MTALATGLTVGRFAISWKTCKHLTLCDAFNGLAAVFLIAFFACWQAYVPAEYALAVALNDDKGEATYVWRDLTYSPYNHLQMNIATSALYWSCIYSVKASFLAMYWTIFRTDNHFRFWWKLAAVYVLAAFVTTIMMRFTLCGEVKHALAYDSEIPNFVFVIVGKLTDEH